MPLFMVFSCGSSKKSIATDKNNSQGSLEFSIIVQEAYGGLEKSEERVITSNKELQEVYGIINRFRKPGFLLPEVDFEKHIVVALFMGEKTTGGFSTEVKSVSMDADKMIVNIVENEPKPKDNVTRAICQPFCFVQIPRTKEGKKIVFKKTR